MKKRVLFLIIILLVPIVLAIPDYVNKETKLFLERECTITEGIDCYEYHVNYVDGANDEIILYLTNLMGDDIKDVDLEILGYNNLNYTHCILECVSGCTGVNSNIIPDNASTIWTWNHCSDIGSKGSNFMASIKFDWTGSGGIPHSRIGFLATRVE